MAKVLTVMNMKGGVGKTVVSVHLAGMLGTYKYGQPQPRRVLLIDYDPQFNASQCFLPAKTYFGLEKEGKTCLSILQSSGTDVDPFHLQRPSKEPPEVADLATKALKIDIIPSTLSLMYVALAQSGASNDLETRFASFMKKARRTYDVIIIDCHPAGSILTKTSLANSDHVLIPVLESPFSARGIGLMLEFVRQIGSHGSAPQSHVVFNLAGGSVGPHEASIRADKTLGGLCVAARLRNFKAFRDPHEGKNFVWYSKRPHSTRAWTSLNALVQEIVSRLTL